MACRTAEHMYVTLVDPGTHSANILPAEGGHRGRRRSARGRGWVVASVLAAAMVVGAIAWVALSSSRRGHATATAASGTAAATSPAGTPVVTPVQAAAVVHRFWLAHERALANRDLRALASMSAGPARAWEQAVVACGCRGVATPRHMLRANYFVPRASVYPANFVAAVQMDERAGYGTEVLVFTKTSARRPWLLTEDSLVRPHYGTYVDLAGPAAASNTFAPAPSTVQHQAATHVVADLAGLWQETKDSSDIPSSSPFEITGPTQDRLSALAAYQQDAVQVNGLLGHYSFVASPKDQLVEVGVAGYDLACQPLHETVVYQATPGSAVLQDAARHNWGPGLAPGRYGAVVDKDVWQTCFLLPPDPKQSIQVFNQDVGGSVTTPYS